MGTLQSEEKHPDADRLLRTDRQGMRHCLAIVESLALGVLVRIERGEYLEDRRDSQKSA